MLAANILAAGDVVLPDPRTGNVDGRVGVLYWPSTMPAEPGQPAQPVPIADGCEAHLVPETDQEQELRYPCGKWFAPPPGRYVVWIESPDRISPRQNLLVYAGTRFRDGGLPALAPLMAAGRIGTPANRAVPPGESIRVFSTQMRTWYTKSAIFDRRLRSPLVQMPAGVPAVLGRFDRKTNDAIALARPVTIKTGETQLVWPTEPAASDVLVILRKPAALQLRKETPTARLTLNAREPDVLVNGGHRIIAVWYGVDATRATIAFESDAAHWEPREIRLTPGKVVTIRDEVKPLPAAKVSINAPVDARLPEETFLVVGTKRMRVGAGVHELHELPAKLLRVTLKVGEWEWDEMLDLTRGEDGTVVFDLEPLTIHGTVFHGKEPAPAKIAFLNGNNRWNVVETDDKGRYETTLWWSDVQTVRVMLPDQPPFLDPFREIFESGRVDFHVPRTDYRVRVRDARTGRGIAGAKVIAGNEAHGGMQLAQHVLTNEDGDAVLPPLRDGELIVSVQAEKYASVEPRRMVVDDKRHELEIVLQPLDTRAELRVVLPNGVAAADAEVWAFDASMQPVWRGKASHDGVLELPDVVLGATLLLRHPQAASSVRAAAGDGVWRLEPPAAPLTLTVDPGAPLAIWLDGVQLSGPALSFAAWSGPSASPDGRWTGRNLPPRELRVLGGNLSSTVTYPW